MTGRALGIPIVALTTLMLGGTRGQEQTVFRARTDLVRVDVSVRDRNRPVAGLPASAFSLEDDGVPQQVEAVMIEEIPIDVTVVLDISTMAEQHRRIGQFHEQVVRLGALLKPQDRLRLLADGTYLTEVLPWRAAATLAPRDVIHPGTPRGGGTSTPDALTAALMHPVEPGRRHLVVAFTQSIDYFSTVEFARVPVIAARSDSVVHLEYSRESTAQCTDGDHCVRHAALHR